MASPFSSVEIERALKQMGATKAPGPDGLPPIFYQKYWAVIGDDVVSKCLEFLNGDGDIGEFNHTLLALIPKVVSPKN